MKYHYNIYRRILRCKVTPATFTCQEQEQQNRTFISSSAVLQRRSRWARPPPLHLLLILIIIATDCNQMDERKPDSHLWTKSCERLQPYWGVVRRRDRRVGEGRSQASGGGGGVVAYKCCKLRSAGARLPSSTNPSGWAGPCPRLGEDTVPVSGGFGNHLQVQFWRHLHLHLRDSFAQWHLRELTWGEARESS